MIKFIDNTHVQDGLIMGPSLCLRKVNNVYLIIVTFKVSKNVMRKLSMEDVIIKASKNTSYLHS